MLTYAIVSLVVMGGTVWLATMGVLAWLKRRDFLDQPNERSSHAVPVPRGGGLALIPLLLVAWLLWSALGPPLPPGFFAVILGAVGLAAVSWLDDRRGLSAGLRLGAQALAVAFGLIAMSDAGLVFQGILPPVLDRLLAGLCWLWFVNLFNFMDGIDGITGVETTSVALGLAVVAFTSLLPLSQTVLPLLMVAAVLGFLPWNWQPAKVFLGDVGSVPLGFLLGWLLLLVAAQGMWAVAIILPLYYWVDASLTLTKRALRREKIWQAHREHAYQRAVQGGVSHAGVCLRVLTCNLVLVVLAYYAVAKGPWLPLVGAFVVVAVLMLVLEREARSAPQ